MWKMWLMFEPRQSFIALVTFLAVLAFSIHALLLSSTRYNWLEHGQQGKTVSAKQMSALPPSY